MRAKLYRGNWYAVWREGGRTQRRALRTKDRDAALRALADYQRSLAAPAAAITGIYAAYLEDKGTERAGYAWRQLAPAFGSLRPDQVTRRACRAYIAERRAAGVSDGTIHTELTFLRAALRWHNRNTPAEIELPSKPPPADDYLTRAEYEKLLAAAETPHIRLFIVLALATAGRMTAILQLTWDRVDFERGLIYLGPRRRDERRQAAPEILDPVDSQKKRRKGRATVPMTQRARRELLAAAKARTTNYVIEYGGGPVKKIRRALSRVAHAAGLDWVTPHVFRHSAAVWMAEDGRPMAEIARFLGHSDSRITERVYAKFSPEFLRRTAAALE